MNATSLRHAATTLRGSLLVLGLVFLCACTQSKNNRWLEGTWELGMICSPETTGCWDLNTYVKQIAGTSYASILQNNVSLESGVTPDITFASSGDGYDTVTWYSGCPSCLYSSRHDFTGVTQVGTAKVQVAVSDDRTEITFTLLSSSDAEMMSLMRLMGKYTLKYRIASWDQGLLMVPCTLFIPDNRSMICGYKHLP